MISEDQARYLIQLPKKLVENNELLDHKVLSPSFPFVARYPLSDEEEGFSFFLDVWQSAKQGIKFTLHFQENSTHYGLLRVDFNGRHKNPEIANADVPELFRPYAGCWLDDSPGHIHYVVDGYPPLAWAVPLELDPFPTKNIRDFTDITAAFQAFCMVVAVRTEITVITQSHLFV
ncbi:DUF6978 family protein [Telluribacter sp.]|jgi:hypothetical protein|uniref:DUF6978 family protein n=1 Tax=Telluribacter sp. TaxID=1978767 RepID=UPI002E111688|nr:hypothetical protein [Telluribacter sp.]